MTKRICVYSSSSDAVKEVFFETAKELGELIAKQNYKLVFGGANIGLMGHIAKYVRKNNGEVIGVMPECLSDKGICFDEASQFVVTKDMRERKAKMELESDAFIALPGGFGTLEEILEILTLKQLQIHNKPVVFINTDGFYNGLIDFFEHIYTENFAKPDYKKMYFVAPCAKDAMIYIDDYRPMESINKWY